MKKLIVSTLVAAVFVLVWNALHEKPITDPVEYANRLVRKHNQTHTLWADFSDAIEARGSGYAMDDVAKLLGGIRSARRFVKKTPPFEGDSGLRDAVAEALDFYFGTCDFEFRQYVVINGPAEGDISDESARQLERAKRVIANGEHRHIQRVRQALSDFSLKFGVPVKESPGGETREGAD